MRQQALINRRCLLLLAGPAAASSAIGLFDAQTSFAAKKKKSNSKKNKSTSTSKKKKSSKKKGSRDKKGKSQSSNGSGDAIVREARKYKGAKYVWAGASPKGFDCSGFTWYVYNKVTGNDIGRTVKEQFRTGNSVSRGALQPGDIVFFKNTFQKGLSHCGIYISGSEFIHAENEDTGVVISSLDSDYYSQHYAGARRLL